MVKAEGVVVGGMQTTTGNAGVVAIKLSSASNNGAPHNAIVKAKTGRAADCVAGPLLVVKETWVLASRDVSKIMTLVAISGREVCLWSLSTGTARSVQ